MLEVCEKNTGPSLAVLPKLPAGISLLDMPMWKQGLGFLKGRSGNTVYVDPCGDHGVPRTMACSCDAPPLAPRSYPTSRFKKERHHRLI